MDFSLRLENRRSYSYGPAYDGVTQLCRALADEVLKPTKSSQRGEGLAEGDRSSADIQLCVAL
jgi:hypothetical protein